VAYKSSSVVRNVIARKKEILSLVAPLMMSTYLWLVPPLTLAMSGLHATHDVSIVTIVYHFSANIVEVMQGCVFSS
jgi:hypothetical protein